MQQLLAMLDAHGLWLVFVNVLLLQLGLPVPAYPTLIVAGAVAARGGIAVPQVIAVAVAASLIADIAWYALGLRFGHRVLRAMCRLSMSPDSCVRRSETLYERWGAPSLMFAKFVPGFAAVATSMAGTLRTRLVPFVFFDAIGAMLWGGVGVAVGWLFHDAIDDAIAAFKRAGLWGLAAVAAALLLYIAAKAVQRQRLLRSLRMARVTVDELNDMMIRGERPLVVDVRSLEVQRRGRIPGAVRIDSQAFDESMRASGIRDRIADEVIVYCSCPNEASAALVAKKLMRIGFRRVRPLAGGIDAWVERGYGVAGVVA